MWGLFVFCFFAGSLARQAINDRPVVGIVTQALEYGYPTEHGNQYIAASYVKYVEASGARVVPIFYNNSNSMEYMRLMYQSINAVLFPGGGQDLDNSPLLMNTALFFLDKAQKAKQVGDYFPVFGHCQGFELLLMAITRLDREKCMTNASDYQAEHVSLPLKFEVRPGDSNWFKEVPSNVEGTLTLTNSTLNNHMWSLPVDMFESLQKTTGLSGYRALTTSVSPNGKKFVSTFESIDFPLYCMQFHAEKPLFEWALENINHSEENIVAMGFLSHFLGAEARKSGHTFPSVEALNRSLIYNYNPVFSNGFSSFDQIYFF